MNAEQDPIHNLLSEGTQFYNYGYEIFGPLDFTNYQDLREKLSDRIFGELIKYNGQPIDGELQLENYHQIIEEKQIDHHAFLSEIRRNCPSSWCTSDFLVKLIATAEARFNCKFQIYNEKIEFRVCRPNQDDNNPMHRDHWFPYFRPLLNIYIPLSGSYCDSALPIAPKSHLWTDEDVVPTFGYGESKTERNGVAFSVPEIKQSRLDIVLHRPDVPPGGFMLFSPLLVHGGGSNSSHETRFSLEIRLEKSD
ncbi:phytanoyl-CoA dioxygenase family protein [Pseudomonadales bacterium]|nr:phytanoyl-CoA dioxygenase family protein [Pseudomonadales bacterium]